MLKIFLALIVGIAAVLGLSVGGLDAHSRLKAKIAELNELKKEVADLRRGAGELDSLKRQVSDLGSRLDDLSKTASLGNAGGESVVGVPTRQASVIPAGTGSPETSPTYVPRRRSGRTR
jgi:hypothetical protein